jgi:acetylornithine deacetylase/succinyl-diaminopimelate desuccinylase family protein
MQTPAVTELLKELVAFDTSNPPGNEMACAEWIAGLLKPRGFDARVVPSSETRGSLVASWKKGKGGKKLVLNGHIDVVPVGENWDTPPFIATEKNGRIYGRGTADMKGGVAAMIAAALNFVQREFTGELVLNFVADEERINLGTLASLPYTDGADYVVIGEPTMMNLNIAHRGTIRFRIGFAGRSCHSGTPQNGLNAIENAALGILALKEYARSLKAVHHPILPSPTCVVTTIEGGETDNIVPGSCFAAVDRRMIPGDTEKSTEEEIRAVLDRVKTEHSEFDYTLERYLCLGPGEVVSDSEIVRLAGQVYRECFGEDCRVGDFTATCEQTIFTSRGMPAIIMGPGSIEQAHIRNEFVEIAQLDKAVRFYKAFLNAVLV